MTTGPQHPAASGRDRLRARHADRQQVIDTLKTAFVQGRLTKGELEARAGQALEARTYADLAALTADLPADRAAAGPAHPPPAPAVRRPMARAAAQSGTCLIIAVAAVWAAFLADPDGPGSHPYHSWARVCLLLALTAIFTAVGAMVHGVGTSVEQRRSRRQDATSAKTGASRPPGPGLTP